MIRFLILASTVATIAATPALAQHGAPGATTPPAQVSQFEFLVGEWTLEVRPRVTGLAARLHGAPRYGGTWKAWKGLDGFGVEDELRIVDASGNPMALHRSLRVYDALAAQWTVTAVDVYRARAVTSSGALEDDAIVLTSRGTDAEGRPYVARTRFYDIRPDRFRMQQDRSTDNGRTWTEGVLRIEARRTAETAGR